MKHAAGTPVLITAGEAAGRCGTVESAEQAFPLYVVVIDGKRFGIEDDALDAYPKDRHSRELGGGCIG